MGTREERRFARSAISNQVLLDRCASGDRVAWESIVNRYERVVLAVARKEGLTAEEAADATQHAFLALVTSLGHIAEPEALQSWLLTVVRREAWRIRGRSRRDVVGVRHRANTDNDFDEAMLRSTEVHAAIEALGEPGRSLILGLFFDPTEPSYVEIAARLGRPVGSIGPMRARYLERLRESLDWFYGDEC